MSIHILEYTHAHLREAILRCANVRPDRRPPFRAYLERSPLARLQQIHRRMFGE